MPREDSFSDADGESLTSDEEVEEAAGPTQHPASRPGAIATSPTFNGPLSTLKGPKSPQNLQGPNGTPSGLPGSQLTPGDRFRATVRKVIALHRTSTAILRGGLGAEPGIDPRRHSAYATYGNIRQKCLIDIVDYSSIRSSFGRMTNAEFVNFLENDQASAREPWVKVRWINVGGISWDVISALALKYDMHPLSVEDLLHRRGHARSKADYFPKHLFLRVLSHTLGSNPMSQNTDALGTNTPATWRSSRTITNLPRSSSPQPLDEKLGILDDGAIGYGYGDRDGLTDDESQTRKATLLDPELGGRKASLLANKRKRYAASLTLDQLKKGERVNVRIDPMCIFLFRDGTVISFHPTPNLDFTEPIATRIRQRDTSLRTTADPSLLVESLLDLIVDGALEVVDEYHARLNKLERTVLIKSKVSTVRSLHILSGDLILHKRTLGPIKTLIYALRRYDLDRTAACFDLAPSADQKVVGYMSHKSKIYLADVHDHMEYVLSSLDMFADMAENLINYTFNMASYEMNEVMRRLTLATIIFLPLTLLTGYFGMNFDNMWTIHHGHTDLVFWIIALPVMSVVAPSFMWPDIVRMVHYIKKRMLARDVKKDFKRD
ncbi:hypothetical protein BC834DRAFT_859558 [Gloeopeniophorella convolvens]|nr:hypothetical protein BC834DRAFT_859558 [Gloeopeniophorella convolvens]